MDGSFSKKTFFDFKLIGIKTYIEFKEQIEWKIKFGKDYLYINTFDYNGDIMELSYLIFIQSVIQVFQQCKDKRCQYCLVSFLCPNLYSACVLCTTSTKIENINDSIQCVICLGSLLEDITIFSCGRHYVHIGCKSTYQRENKNMSYKCPLRCHLLDN